MGTETFRYASVDNQPIALLDIGSNSYGFALCLRHQAYFQVPSEDVEGIRSEIMQNNPLTLDLSRNASAMGLARKLESMVKDSLLEPSAECTEIIQKLQSLKVSEN